MPMQQAFYPLSYLSLRLHFFKLSIDSWFQLGQDGSLPFSDSSCVFKWVVCLIFILTNEINRLSGELFKSHESYYFSLSTVALWGMDSTWDKSYSIVGPYTFMNKLIYKWMNESFSKGLTLNITQGSLKPWEFSPLTVSSVLLGQKRGRQEEVIALNRSNYSLFRWTQGD